MTNNTQNQQAQKKWQPKPWDTNGEKTLTIDENDQPVLEKKVQKRKQVFATLVDENFRALEGITVLRDNASLEQLVTIFSSIRKMAWCYCALADVSYTTVTSEIRRVYQTALDALEQALIARQCGYDCIIPYAPVEVLSPALENPDKEDKFRLENCVTPHDLIRFLHQTGESALFSADNGFIKCETVNGDKYTFYQVIDLGGVLNKGKIQAKPLQALDAFYKQPRSKKRRGYGNTITYNVLGQNDRIQTRVRLGCHSAELDMQVSDDSFIWMRFFDTLTENYPNAKYRTQYVQEVLKALHFTLEPTEKKNITEAWCTKEAKETSETITNVIALLVSARDLDLSDSPLPTKMDRAIRAFFDGHINLWEVLK